MYRPIWLGDPALAFRGSQRDTRLTVFQATNPPHGRNLATPLMRLRPLQGQPNLARQLIQLLLPLFGMVKASSDQPPESPKQGDLATPVEFLAPTTLKPR